MCGIGTGLTSGIAKGLSLSKSGTGIKRDKGPNQVVSEVRVSRSLVFYVMFCGSLLVFVVFLLDFFDLRLLVTPLISSNVSYTILSGV